MAGGARERKATEKGKAYTESRKTVRRAPVDMKGLISKMKSLPLGVATERSAMGMEIEVPSAPKAFEMKAATFGAPKPKDDEMDALAAQLSKSGLGGRKRKTRRRRSRSRKHRR
jgi:hypothetical protein